MKGVDRPSDLLMRRVRGAHLPSCLYHYTSQAGCIGIFSTKTIWATSIRFFNDEKEFVLAHDLAHEYLSELAATGDRGESGLFHRLLEEFSITSAETYVTSFSAKGDLLSQWRGYAASGYSLGFSTEHLAKVARGDLLLAPCVYDESQQAQLIHEYADATTDYFRALVAVGMDVEAATDQAIEEFQAVLGIVAPIIKHHSFREEGEWRLIASRVGANSGRLRFRPGRSMIVPFVELPLQAKSGELLLDEVIIGPTPHPDSAEMAVHMLQLHTGVRVQQIRQSEIPFRDW